MTESRAEYFRERRKDKKNLSAYIDREKAEKLENKLKAQNLSKREWLDQIVDDELTLNTERVIECPYCGNAEEMDLSEGVVSCYEREMGEEILHQYDDEFVCENCGKEFKVRGYISEYPIGVVNDEKLKAYPKEE